LSLGASRNFTDTLLISGIVFKHCRSNPIECRIPTLGILKPFDEIKYTGTKVIYVFVLPPVCTLNFQGGEKLFIAALPASPLRFMWLP